jgi:hypothetical protein
VSAVVSTSNFQEDIVVNGTRLTSLVACGLVALLALPPQLHAQVVSGPEIWRSFAEKLEPGKTIEIRLKDGARFKATLLQVSPDAMTVQPRTRAAVPPQRVPFDAVERVDVHHDKGIGIVKAVAIGAGVAAGAWLALMALAFAVWGD